MENQQNNGEIKANQKKPFYKTWWFIAIAVIVVLSMIGSLEDDKNKKEAKQEEQKVENKPIETTPKIKETAEKPIESNSNNQAELPESTYKERVFSEGEKISKAGAYISQAGTFFDSKDYDTYESFLFKASSEFKSVKWTFEGQKNPPAKYKNFNESMINIFSDIIDTIENDLTLSGVTTDDGKTVSQTKFNTAIAKLISLINKANSEMTKAGF